MVKEKRGVAPYVVKGLMVGSTLNCVDNTGAKIVKIISIKGYSGKKRRIPRAGVGSMVIATVKKGTPELVKTVVPVVIVRQKKEYRRPDGTRVKFEDNAAVIVTPEGNLKGSEIKGPIAKEVAEAWPNVAAAATTIV